MEKTYESILSPSLNLDKVTVRFDKLINTDTCNGLNVLNGQDH